MGLNQPKHGASLDGGGTGQDTTELQKRISNLYSTGVLDGGIVSINAIDNTKFDIAAGQGFITNNYSDSTNPSRTHIVWGAKVGVTPIYLVTNNASYVGIDINGDVAQQPGAFDLAQARDIIVLGKLLHIDNTIIEDVLVATNPGFDTTLEHFDLSIALGPININGNAFYANGANLRINKSAGTAYNLGVNYNASKKIPSVANNDALIPVTFRYVFRVADEWEPSAEITEIDPDHYDDGNLQNVTAGFWTIQTFYHFSNSNHVVVQYGQGEYATKEDAMAAPGRTDYVTICPDLYGVSFRGWLIIKQGAVALNNTNQAVFIPAGKFGLVDIASSNVGGEVNTASNIGAGLGVYKNKVGVDLRFKSLTATSGKIVLTNNANDIGVDANLSHSDLSGVTANQHHARDHASTHSEGAADPVTVEDLATAGAIRTVPVSQGDGTLAMEPKGMAKEICFKGYEQDTKGDFRGQNILGGGTYRITFAIPSDFNTLTSLQLIGIPNASFTDKALTLNSDYGAIGELYNNHSETTTFNISGTINVLKVIDASGVFSVVAANDCCGLKVDQIAGLTMFWLGIKLKYS